MTSLRTLAMSASLISALSVSASALAGPPAPELLPPVSNPGECYARIKVPAQFAADRQGVMTDEGHTTLQVRDPQFRARQENVMVKEPSVRFAVRQPTYRSVTEQIMVRPAYDKLSVSQPQFSEVTERIQTSAPHLVWKKGNPGQLRAQGYVIHSTADGRARPSYGHSGGGQSAFHGAGLGGQACGPGCEIWCLVEEPGESTTVRRRVMTSPGDVRRTPVPAKYQSVVKQVVSDPGGVQEIPVPAEFRSVTVEDIVDPGGAMEVAVPPSYASVETKTMISPERYEWRRVLCAPGTGSIKSSGSYSGGSYQDHAYSSGYSSGTATSYSSPSVPSYGSAHSNSYRTHDYGSSGTVSSRRGYYGTEDYPAYGNQSYVGSHSRKRAPRRH